MKLTTRTLLPFGTAALRRRAALALAASMTATAAMTACSNNSRDNSAAPPPGAERISADLQELMNTAPWSSGKWGLQVVDLQTGKVVQSKGTDSQFLTGSTAKTFAVSAALDVLGADHRFRTPVVHSGTVSADGRLSGNLIMIGSGDLALGGRTTASGGLDVPDFDHYDANAVPGMATITTEVPLAGINELARKVAASGVRQVDGDVVIDNRLWDPVSIGEVPVTPTVVNDNLIDVLITPGAPGSPAQVDWRPKTAAFSVDAQVTTTPAGSKPTVTTDSVSPGHIRVRGSVPADAKAPFVTTYQVPDPAAFARTVLIEALARNGVSVSAPPLGKNPEDKLPPSKEVNSMPVSATYTSPPFKEYARLINKVSHNLGANLLPLLMAAHNGQRTYADGMKIENEFIARAGVDPHSVSLVDAQGTPGNKATPAAQVTLLRHLARQDNFDVLYDSMPSMGVDGSLSDVIEHTNPAAGHIRAKTGTFISSDNDKLTLATKALAGYIDAKDNRRYAFAIYVNNIPVPSKSVSDAVDLALKANKQLGAMAATIYKSPSTTGDPVTHGG
ncbi:D-alanyl-D-alanine carboxypeptidase/D-alanyl-D-alanine-endopeptidase [Streptomyces sp. VNUA116]|uniref:D-alanyl-D-alanine carboxypeptidase/D-alanyl-D-alanine endopeptidase n=1 Tax=Streptomyces sp. VNUA116 TaxID=3062449 RepID=UPI0026750D44|nr:D-alanyl-D-alanine carboxypeptidase/D-alanyl-D-alanine-endopeptidase [Streptomyces sp. VNUA116]WKU48047.1 D-alanyl-D-alanine carboxypeptidase/D-alanyl-D-alanine-endopeptidase [Streptomyces sp. VNUA116]